MSINEVKEITIVIIQIVNLITACIIFYKEFRSIN